MTEMKGHRKKPKIEQKKRKQIRQWYWNGKMKSRVFQIV